jgi:hypothetical protein
MIGYTFLVRLFHSQLQTGLSRRFPCPLFVKQLFVKENDAISRQFVIDSSHTIEIDWYERFSIVVVQLCSLRLRVSESIRPLHVRVQCGRTA